MRTKEVIRKSPKKGLLRKVVCKGPKNDLHFAMRHRLFLALGIAHNLLLNTISMNDLQNNLTVSHAMRINWWK